MDVGKHIQFDSLEEFSMLVSQELITAYLLLRGTKWLKFVKHKSRENQVLMLITQKDAIRGAITHCSSTPCLQN